MKKLFYSIIVVSLLFSCSKDYKEMIITDFNKPVKVTLEPHRYKPYAMMNIYVKGSVNDSIKIKLHSEKSKPIMILSGNLDERWYTDYYGDGPITFIFEPYKATKGKIELKFML